MKTDEILNLIGDKDFLDKIYRFSYHRCNTSFDAEDLCSDIILSLIAAIQSQTEIGNFYGFVWTIARRVYADFCKKRNKTSNNISIQNTELQIANKENEIDKLVEKMADREQLKKIFSEIAFLSKIYREVMVMYYIDEMKIKDISEKLEISETTVKQRLFSARNTVRSEVETMNDRNLSLKPIRMKFFNTGSVIGNIPSPLANRTLSQNLIYLCKDKEKTAKELSDELCVPMIYVEEELEIQCLGQNGTYGNIRKLDNGKYISNILIAEYQEFQDLAEICEKYSEQLSLQFKNNYMELRKEILDFPYLNVVENEKFILWAYMLRCSWELERQICAEVNNYFADIVPTERMYATVANVHSDEITPDYNSYGNDGIHANSISGFKSVHMRNCYGKYIDRHFTVGHNISNDEKMLILLKSIDGILIDSLTESEKEIAAKAIESNYIKKVDNLLKPKVVTFEQKDEYYFEELAVKLCEFDNGIIKDIAKEISQYMRKHIQKHLLDEYQNYLYLVAAIRIPTILIEGCIKQNLLYKPVDRLGGEGVILIVEKE
ncbi:MAG: RNA polymerase sigma factor [Clostridia bacterium]|nr:RNA polymerase sigma factor [Clostridia bacterium]